MQHRSLCFCHVRSQHLSRFRSQSLCRASLPGPVGCLPFSPLSLHGVPNAPQPIWIFGFLGIAAERRDWNMAVDVMSQWMAYFIQTRLPGKACWGLLQPRVCIMPTSGCRRSRDPRFEGQRRDAQPSDAQATKRRYAFLYDQQLPQERQGIKAALKVGSRS